MNVSVAISLVALLIVLAFAILFVIRGKSTGKTPGCPPDASLKPNNNVTASSNYTTYQSGSPFEFSLAFTDPNDFDDFGQKGWQAYICYSKDPKQIPWDFNDHQVSSLSEKTGSVQVNAHDPNAQSQDKPGFGAGKGKVIVTSDEFGGGQGTTAKPRKIKSYIVGYYIQPDGTKTTDGLTIEKQ